MDKCCPCFGFSLRNEGVQGSDLRKDVSVPQPTTASTVSRVIPPNSTWRACAASFAQLLNEEQAKLAAQHLLETVYNFNCSVASSSGGLPQIVYRTGEEDILRQVFRWDLTPCEEVFQNGFHVNRQQDTPDSVYYNLDHYIHHQGDSRPLDSRLPAAHAFISTTVDPCWHLTLGPEVSIDVYRYEIYAPGGIWVAQTLGDRYPSPSIQDEVCFVAGIAPQYIRSTQCFRLTTIGGMDTRRKRVDNTIKINGNFHPQSHPSKLLYIQRPIFDCLDDKGRRLSLNTDIYQGHTSSSTGSGTTSWYAGKVANSESYINAAFRSSRKNEAYLFMKNEYAILNYAPGTTNDKVLIGPVFICSGFSSLTGTSFTEHGIDCAFGSHDKDQAFIFSGNLCAQINYVPHTKNEKILNGPMTITAMFPFLQGTVFENGIQAAFESRTKYEVYLFKDNHLACINYNGFDSCLISPVCPIIEVFPSLKNTIFESGIDAAFASHRTGEAYLFKDDFYSLFFFAPDNTKDRTNGVKKILPNWPSLRSILPRKNRGLDVHEHAKPNARKVHDHV